MYKINFYPKAKTEIKNFDNSIQKQILKKLEKISINPEVGQNLTGNLAGLKKVYVSNKKIRIIYTIINDKIEILVIAIGKRENEKVYKDAFKRI